MESGVAMRPGAPYCALSAPSPFPGASTGSGGEIRDEGATGRGARPKAGLCGFTTSNLNLPEVPINNRLRHAIVQERRETFNFRRGEHTHSRNRVERTALNTFNGINAAIHCNIGCLRGPRGNGALARDHH